MKELKLLTGISLTCLLLTSCQYFVRPIAGNFNLNILEEKAKLSDEAKKIIDDTFKGLDPKCTVDFHVHAVGLGANQSGAWVNPKMLDKMSPKHFTKYNVYMSASGITDIGNADKEYLTRLVNLLRAEPRMGRVLLFAFDYFHDMDGNKVKEKSSFHIPNDYVIEASKLYPDLFVPVSSIHPYRKDALKELERVHKEGVRFIKWLPNSQHIDALDGRTLTFITKMKELDMTLITHTGEEKAVEGEEYQKLGNPLRFRKALDTGARIVMAHFASLGQCEDLDNPKSDKKSCFDLFWRLMEEERYKNNLYGETSALTLYTRLGKPLNTLLQNPKVAARVVHGSDYPLPAINILYRTSQYVEEGYLPKSYQEPLNEIYRYNPLLYNLVVKRNLGHPKTGSKMANIIFHGKDLLECQK